MRWRMGRKVKGWKKVIGQQSLVIGQRAVVRKGKGGARRNGEVKARRRGCDGTKWDKKMPPSARFLSTWRLGRPKWAREDFYRRRARPGRCSASNHGDLFVVLPATAGGSHQEEDEFMARAEKDSTDPKYTTPEYLKRAKEANSVEVHSVIQYLEYVASLAPYAELWFRGIGSTKYGLSPGLVWRGAQKDEPSYVHRFLVSYKAMTHLRYDNPWELYALMQHHGLPTRLLDWSKSPLVALYFALTQDADVDDDRVVWFLQPSQFNRVVSGIEKVFCPGALASRKINESGVSLDLDHYLPSALVIDDDYVGLLPEKPIAIEAPLSGDRIVAQSGCFTVHGGSPNTIDYYLKENDQWPPFASSFVLKTKGRLKEFTEVLYSLGLTEDFIFRDLDSLSTRIKRELSTS